MPRKNKLNSDKRLKLQRDYLMFIAKHALEMTDSDIARAFNMTRQMVASVLKELK